MQRKSVEVNNLKSTDCDNKKYLSEINVKYEPCVDKINVLRNDGNNLENNKQYEIVPISIKLSKSNNL